MKRHRTLALLAGLAAIVAALIVADRHRPSTDEAARARDKLLPDLERAAVDAIDVDAVSLRRRPDGWWMEPAHRCADDDAVENLLSTLRYASIERRVAKASASQPRVTIRVAGHLLALDGDDPGGRLYVERDGERLVVAHGLLEAAQRSWLSMRPTLSDLAAARAIETDAWRLERKNGWRVTRPAAARAAEAKVDALVSALSRARAVAVENEAKPAPAVTLSLDGVKQGAFGVDRVARADGVTLRFAAAELALVRAPATTFAERRLFPFRLDDVVAADAGALQLRRENGAWRVIAPPDAVGAAKDEAVRAWLEPLLAAEARGFGAETVGAGTRIRVATRDDEVVALVDGARARRAGEGVTLELAAPLAPSTDASRLH